MAFSFLSARRGLGCLTGMASSASASGRAGGVTTIPGMRTSLGSGLGRRQFSTEQPPSSSSSGSIPPASSAESSTPTSTPTGGSSFPDPAATMSSRARILQQIGTMHVNRSTLDPSTSSSSSSTSQSTEYSSQNLNLMPRTMSPVRVPTREEYQTRLNAPDSDLFHLHAYCHRHNTHLTLTKPNREVLVSISAGNVGFRKGRRKHYDSAYQLAAHMCKLVDHHGLLAKIGGVEVIFRDFGPGREAFTKVLLGTEGVGLREKVVRVTDASRFKYGGTRSPKPRRLG